MNMLLFLGILFVIAASLLVLVIYKTSSNVKKTRRRTSKNAASLQAGSPWRATSIVHGKHACEAVKAIANKRFLDIEQIIPALPLPNCNVSACSCKYEFFEDRRTHTEDRRHLASLQSKAYSGGPNRRQKKRGRRKGDRD
jgi:hypothetical protein